MVDRKRVLIIVAVILFIIVLLFFLNDWFNIVGQSFSTLTTGEPLASTAGSSGTGGVS